jgi:hypothetical protein
MLRLRLFLAAFGLLILTALGTAAPVHAQGVCIPEEALSDLGPGTYSGQFNCVGRTVNYTGTITQNGSIETSSFTGSVVGAGTMTFSGTYNDNTGQASYTMSFSDGGSFTTTYNDNTSILHIAGNYNGVTLNCTINGSDENNITFSGECGGIAAGTFSGLASTKIGAVGRTQELVVNNVLDTPLMTAEEKAESDASPSASGAPQVRLFLADLAVETNTFAGQKSTITGVTVGTTVEFDNNFKVGALVPLDRMFLPGNNATRVGLVVYGQYDYQMENGWSVKPTVFTNYIHTSQTGGSSGVYGGGGGLSAQHDDGGTFIPQLISMINYYKDTRTGGGSQTLAAIGPRLGMRTGNNMVFEVGGMWNKAVSGSTGVDSSFIDVMGGIAYRISGTFRVDASYRTTLGISQFKSHRFMFGGRFFF